MRRTTRRQLLLALGALLAAPSARAQSLQKPARIAWFGGSTPEAAAHLVDAFKQGLRELGYVEGTNYFLEVRYAQGKTARIPAIAKDLVGLKPDVILIGSTNIGRALLKETKTIPIVMATVADPVRSGLVKSLAHPGGNVTGLAFQGITLLKVLEFLRVSVPNMRRAAILSNPSNPIHPASIEKLQEEMRALNLAYLVLSAPDPAALANEFERIRAEPVEGLIVLQDNFFYAQRKQVAELAIKGRVPSVFMGGEYTDAGGLISYAANNPEQFRRAASYVDKILRGTKPQDLPIQEPTTLELVLNLKTARAIGVKFPQSLLLRADRVIE